MAELVYLVLGVLLGSSLLEGDLEARLAERFRAELGAVDALTVRLQPPREPRGFGHYGAVEVTADGLDAHRLPLAALVPLPRPRTPKGRLDRLVLRATQVHLDDLDASELVFEATDVTYDTALALREGAIRITSIGSQNLVVRFRDGDLDRYAAAAFPELTGPHITFEEGEVVATASIPLLFAAFPATVRGGLTITDGRQVRLVNAHLDTGRVELSAKLRESLLKRLDPLIDLDQMLKFPVPLTWQAFELRPGEALIRGQLETPRVVDPPPAFQPRERYLR